MLPYTASGVQYGFVGKNAMLTIPKIRIKKDFWILKEMPLLLS
ncbi:hypothetical protein [uncultured Methanobrevibacter sp.]|nr:hypothetical protein [uncultured Methanobrevibacter sp.]